METSSQLKTETMTAGRLETVLRSMEEVDGGIWRADIRILMVSITTHPVPQMALELCGSFSMVIIILLKPPR